MKETTKPKEQFQDRLIEWSQGKLNTSFSNLNNMQQSRQMIQFFVSEILEKLYPGIVPDDEGELESCIIDGAGDGGADFLYRNDEGQVLVIQAKYRGKQANETAENVGRFCDFLERLYLATKGQLKGLNKELLELASQIDWEEDKFRLFYITTGRTTEAVRARVNQGLAQIPALPDLTEYQAEFRYLDFSHLNEELREALSSADFSERPVVIQMIPDANGTPWCHFQSKDRELYLGEVSGAVLAHVLETHKASLFTMNIRDYVGDTKTNKQITKTALESPGDFEYYNNGVTAIAGRITPDVAKKTLTCEKMSIINGAQTVRSLRAAVKKPGAGIHKPVSVVRVMLRLMSFDYPTEIPFVGEVTKYNNTQNAVKIADFRSNDSAQRDMAKRFKALNFQGRTYEYKNKRSDKKRNTIPITLEELTKAVFAFRFGPDDIYGGTGKLFDASPQGLYRKVFESPDLPLSESEFNLIAGTFFACDYVKQLWELNRKTLRASGKSMHPALERKGLVYYAVGELQRKSYQEQGWDMAHDLSKLGRPNSWIGVAGSPTALALSKAFEVASLVLEQQYDSRKNAEAAFKHRNWFRDATTLTTISSGISMALKFGFPPRLWKH